MQGKRWPFAIVALLSLAFFLAACDDNGDNGDMADPTETEVSDPVDGEDVVDPTAPDASAPDGDGIEVIAASFAFDPGSVNAPTGEAFLVSFENQDDGIPHNFAIFESEDAAGADEDPIAATAIESGPDAQRLEVPALEAGEYFVWCQVHTTSMTATLVVE